MGHFYLFENDHWQATRDQIALGCVDASDSESVGLFFRIFGDDLQHFHISALLHARRLQVLSVVLLCSTSREECVSLLHLGATLYVREKPNLGKTTNKSNGIIRVYYIREGECSVNYFLSKRCAVQNEMFKQI